MKWWLAIALIALLTACGNLHEAQPPDVSLTGLRLGQSEGMSQTVLIDLTITNPNTETLKFNAISYRVRVEGRDIVNGSNREPLEIAAGGSQKYTVPASISLMSGFGLIRDLTTKSKTSIAYELSATLEPSGLFSMPIMVNKVDTFSVSQ